MIQCSWQGKIEHAGGTVGVSAGAGDVGNNRRYAYRGSGGSLCSHRLGARGRVETVTAMDNPGSYKCAGSQERQWSRGQSALPPPCLLKSPIENALAKLKVLLRKAERIVGGLWNTIDHLIACFTQDERANYSQHAHNNL